MEFNSLFFIFICMPLLTGSLYFIKNNGIRNGIILLFSLLFYALGDIKHIGIILITIALAYLFAKKVKGNGKAYFSYITVQLLILAIYKYSFLQPVKLLTMPLGVSFFTFTAISYVSDVYYEKYEYERNIFSVANYILFFPTVISGPLNRFDVIKKGLNEKEIHIDHLAHGLRRFIIGLGKKVIFANQLAIICDAVFQDSTRPMFLLSVYGLAAYAMQLYYDFSGYSDMAIGIGEMIGFEVPENFDEPYFSHSITEFWRRWHITLGSWFKEYLYYPILRSKWLTDLTKKIGKTKGKKTARKITNAIALTITWTLIGCWHGASWRFVLYGMYHGFFVITSTLFEKQYKKFREKWQISSDSKWFRCFQIIRTDVLVTIGYILFRSESLRQIKNIVKGLIGRGEAVNMFYIRQLDILYLLPYLLLAFLLSFPFVHRFFKKLEEKMPTLYDLGLIGILLVSVLLIVSGSYSAFIYFNF